MLKNYIKIALRNLWKNKIDSAISIGGLAVGLACCILLVFYVRFEWSHDNFHEYADQVYRVTYQSTQPNSGEVYKSVSIPYPLGEVLRNEYPEIAEVTQTAGGQIYIEENEKFVSQTVIFTGPGFFRMFSFPLLYGDLDHLLHSPGSIVISEESAMRLFGKKEVIGETITTRLHDELYTLTVEGVAQSVPANSSIRFDMVLPFENFFRNEDPSMRNTARESWWVSFSETWVMLKPDIPPAGLESKFPDFVESRFGDFGRTRQIEFGLQPFKGAYFNQEYQSAITGNANKLYSIMLGGIALVILAIGGMNFMSLTLTRAYGRSHEIGIRKAAGAKTRQIHSQIFGEVFITCLIAFIIGLMLAEVASPLFQQFTGKSFQVNIFYDPVLWALLAGMILLVTIVTGVYPAVRMSRKNASDLFSSQRAAERIPVFVKGLICVQFTLAIAFIIATFIMHNQLGYLLNKDLGYSASNVVIVELNLEGEDGDRLAGLYSREARNLPGIQQVSVVSGAYRAVPQYIRAGYGIGMGTHRSSTSLPGFEDGIISETTDEYYLETLDIELLAGRNFSQERPADLDNGIIINDLFAEIMGWDDPVGRVITDKAEGWTPLFDGKEVIGVISNYHFRPLHEPLQPIALQHIQSREYGPPGTLLVKTTSGPLAEHIFRLSVLWDEIVPGEVFSYNFLDEMVAIQYQEEQRWKNIIRFASFIAIALACFGLFGLAALAAQRRTKEIGIRKVMGASVAGIVALLSKDFLKLVLIGFVIAIPIAWYTMNRWLEDFAYRIEIGPGVFLLAGFVAVLIALATVSWQSVKAAVANPVEALRSE